MVDCICGPVRWTKETIPQHMLDEETIALVEWLTLVETGHINPHAFAAVQARCDMAQCTAERPGSGRPRKF